MIKTSITEVQSLGKCLLSQHTEAVFQRQPRLYLVLAAELGSVKATQLVLVFKTGKGLGEKQRVGTLRQC